MLYRLGRSTCRCAGATLGAALVFLVLAGCTTLAGRKPITAETLWGPRPVDFNGSYVSGLSWAPDGRHYFEYRDGVLQRVDALTDEATPAYDYLALEAVLRAHEDFAAAAAEHLARHPTLADADYTAVLLQHQDRLYFFRFAEHDLRRLTAEAADRREITLSPDAAHVAFVLDNNIYAVHTATGREVQLTTDGSETLLNGVLDWVYQEEIYGRGNWRSYWWSDDGSRIAYLQLDESEVPTYPLVDYLPTHPTVEPLRYPKAGDPNPQVRLGVVQPDGGDTAWVDLSSYEGTDILITRVSWSPDGRVIYAVQDRESRWLDLNEADPDSGAPRTLLHESSPAWIEYDTPPRWLADGTFLWLSVLDGWQHLYHHARDGQLIRRVTAGEWDVRRVHGVDEDDGWVYFAGTCDSPVELHAYRVRLDGSGFERLTEPGFSHDADFDPCLHYFIDTFSNVITPPKVYLRHRDGGVLRVISANDVPALTQYRLSPPQLLRVPTPHGHCLNALIIRPPASLLPRKHPVFVFVYGGPHMPSVHNRWEGGRIFQQWLAQQGYLVWACDPYSASGEGAVSGWHAYQRLGETELADIEASVHWLAQCENADLTRVGIVGHSYGGYLVTYALTHSKMFTMGIAGSALTDWRNYDSVYAERLMRMPANNVDGYRRSSAVEAAGALTGQLLLVHGAVDDNVHLSNIMQFVHRAQASDRPFTLMIYPDMGHGVWGEHWENLQSDFIRRNLRDAGGQRPRR